MKHLYTLTGNLLAETTVTIPTVAWGNTHRAVEESFQVGGKGINVAKMAQRLGLFSTAVCFPGGHNGNRCLGWLEARMFGTRAFAQVAETRAGWVVRAEGKETTFLGCDRKIEEGPWREAMRYLERSLNEGDILAICGSLPGWGPSLAEPLGELLEKLAGKIFFAVDTYGEPLADLVRQRVDLVKINREELRSLRALDAADGGLETALGGVARETPQVRRWVVTDGSEAVVAIDEEGKTVRVRPPEVKVVSPVGCGDVMLAGLIHELAVNQEALETALRKALPLAAANAASLGVAEFEM